MAEHRVGERVDYRGTECVVRFVGTTAFAAGTWVGLELPLPAGKNDGSVNGEKYFECAPQHGLFVRPSQLRAIATPAAPSPAPAAAAAAAPAAPLAASAPPPAAPPAAAVPPPATPPAATPARAADFRASLRAALLDKPRDDRTPAAARSAVPAVGSARPPRPAAPTAAPSRIAAPTSRVPSRASAAAPPAARSASPSPNLSSAGSPVPAAQAPGTPRAASRVSSISSRAPASPQRPPAATVSSPAKLPAPRTPSRAASTSTSRPASPAKGAVGLGLHIPDRTPGPRTRLTSAAGTPLPDGPELDLAAESLGDLNLADISAPPSPTHEEPPVVATPPRAQASAEASPALPPVEEIEPEQPEEGDKPGDAEDAEPLEDTADNQDTVEAEDVAHHAVPGSPQPGGAHGLLSPRSTTQAMHSRELEELRVRVRVMERQREEDLHRLTDLVRLGTEVDLLEREKAKLGSRVTELQAAAGALKEELRAAREGRADLERRLEEAAENLESMTLDKEVAEEKADALGSEVAALKDRVEELQIEVEILKAEGEQDGLGEPGASRAEGGGTEVRELRKQIDVLKDALVKLRDISNENEVERRKRIQALEREVASLASHKAKAEELAEQLASAQEALENLKQQLDDALDAEDMVVALTEKNLALGEKLEELRAANEDLEALKELGDELEENHVETERQLQEALAATEAQVREQQGKLDEAAESLADYERTIEQFRGLVRSLQSDIETLQATSSQRLESEHHLSSQTQAMMSLTLRLQNTASDVKAKQVELDLRRIEAEEAAAKVRLMEPYIPEAVVEKDAHSMASVLAMQRLRQKAELLAKYAEQEGRGRAGEVRAPAVAELEQGLRYFAGLCARFEGFMDVCSVSEFLELGKLADELVGTERRIDAMLELSKEQALAKSPQVLVDLQRCVTQMEHLSSSHIGNNAVDDTLVRSYTCQLYSQAIEALMDRLEAEMHGLSHVFSASAEHGIEDAGEAPAAFAAAHDAFFGAVRDELWQHGQAVRQSAKKLQRRIADLAAEAPGFVPHADVVEQLVRVFNNCTRAADFFRQLAGKVEAKLRGEGTAGNADLVQDLEKLLLESETQVLRLGEEPAWTGARAFLESLESAAAEVVDQSLADGEAEPIERGVSPRVLRGKEIKEHYVLNLKLEKESSELSREVATLALALKQRDEFVQQSSVKIELLEKRMGDSREQAEVIMNLEAELKKSQEQEGIFERAVEELQAEVEQLQQENTQLKRAGRKGGFRSGASTPALDGDGGQDGFSGAIAGPSPYLGDLGAALSTMSVSGQVEALRVLVRYLRLENARLTAQAALMGGMGRAAGSSAVAAEPDPLVRRMARISKAADAPASDEQGEPEPRNAPHRVLADLRNALAAPRVVDLSKIAPPIAPSTDQPAGRHLVRWIPRRADPVQQYREQLKKLDSLLKEAEQIAAVSGKRRQRRADGGAGLPVGRLRLPGTLGDGDRPSNSMERVHLDWQGLESLHRLVLAV
ncbi:dynein associated protein-domain-containing protein [Hyaloraphidium curvatum]|nr:dynein associated protein-domain-containing protein [Hyaloraphidium curvatum]